LNGTFEDLTQKIKEKEPDYLKNKDEVDTDKSNFLLVKNYYNMCLDSKARDELGYTSIFPYVAQIENTLLSTDKEIDPETLAQVLAVAVLQDVPTFIDLTPITNPLDHNFSVPLLKLPELGTDVDYTDINSLNKYRDSLTSLLNKVLGGPSTEDYNYEQMVIKESKKSNFTLWSSSKIELAVSRFIDFEIQLSSMQNM
jgi:predicted metalloendopeptidase